MNLLDSLIQSLLSPMVLAFLLGIIASLIKSDLKFPPELYSALTIYLLFAIGLKGGAKLVGLSFSDIWLPMTAAILLSLAIPLWCFAILRKLGKFDGVNSAALCAHYGSVSAVTFAEGVAFLDLMEIKSEPFMPAMLTVMEVPAILVAILLVGRSAVAGGSGSWGKVIHELISGKGVVLLIGGMAIGLLGGEKGYTQVAPLFDTPFRGVLTLFLLEIGLITGRSLGDVKKAGKFLIGFALIMPMIHGIIGALLGHALGLSVGGTTLLATLAASASYIAAPAAVRVALPQANPALYFTASLALTFPFNVVIGIPTYYALAEWLNRT
jgi:hypothetical protein